MESPTQTDIDVNEQDGIHVLSMPSSVDSDKLQGKIQWLLDSDSKLFALDLEKITFIESSGLGALVSSFKQAQNGGGRLVVFNPQPYVKKLVEITKLNRILTICHSKQDAISTLKG